MKTGASAASAAPACNANTQSACFGVRGSHLIAKNATIGICSHEYLPDMDSGPLIGLAGNTEHGDVNEHDAAARSPPLVGRPCQPPALSCTCGTKPALIARTMDFGVSTLTSAAEDTSAAGPYPKKVQGCNLPAQRRYGRPSCSMMTPAGRDDRIASYVFLPPPRCTRSECNTRSILPALSGWDARWSALPATHAAQNSLNRLLLHSAQGRCPAASEVASSRKNSSL